MIVKIKKKVISITLALAMMTTSLVGYSSISFADTSKSHLNQVNLKENVDYDIGMIKKSKTSEDDELPVGKLEKFDATPEYSHNEMYSNGIYHLTAKVKKVNDKYIVKLPVAVYRMELNFRNNEWEKYSQSGFQYLKESDGKLIDGKVIRSIQPLENSVSESGQWKQELKELTLTTDELNKPIYIKSILTKHHFRGGETDKNVYSKYTFDLENFGDNKLKFDVPKIEELLEKLNIEDKPSGETGENNEEGKYVYLSNGNKVRVDNINDEKDKETLLNQVKEIGLNKEKYNKYLLFGEDISILDDVIRILNDEGFMTLTNDMKLAYLQIISDSEKGKNKSIILTDGERINIPTSDNVEEIASSYVKLIKGKDDNFDGVSLDKKSYPESIDVKGSTLKIDDILNKFDDSYLDAIADNSSDFIELLEAIVNSEKKSTSDTYNLSTVDGIVSVKKSDVKKINSDVFNNISNILTKLDESKYVFPIMTYKNRQELIKGFNAFKTEKEVTNKVEKPALLNFFSDSYKSSVNYFDETITHKNKMASGLNFTFYAKDVFVDNRIDLKFTLDGTEPTEKSESMREEKTGIFGVEFDQMKEYGSKNRPLQELPNAVYSGGTVVLKVKAFQKGMEPSETLTYNCKIGRLYDDGLVKKATYFEGEVHESYLGNPDLKFKEFGVYNDSKLDINRINSGEFYEKVKKGAIASGLNNFALLNYKITDPNGEPAEIENGRWLSEKFNDKELPGHYNWIIQLRLNKGKNLYPLDLNNDKIDLYRVSDDGKISKIEKCEKDGVFSKSGNKVDLIFDINDYKGNILLVEKTTNDNVGELKKQYKDILDKLSGSKENYESQKLNELLDSSKKVYESFNDNTAKEKVLESLNKLKMQILELKMANKNQKDYELEKAIADSKNKLTRILKTEDSLSKLDKLVESIEKNKSSMSDKEKEEASTNIRKAISSLEMIYDGFKKQPKLSDGIYEIPIQMRMFGSVNEISMGNNAIEGIAKLTIKNGIQNIEFDVKSVNMSNLEGRVIKINYFEPDNYDPTGGLKKESDLGEPKQVNVIKKENLLGFDGKKRDYVTKVSIPLNKEKENPKRYIGISVDVMNGLFGNGPDDDVFKYGVLVLDYGQIKSIKNDDPEVPTPNPDVDKDTWTVPVEMKMAHEDRPSMGSLATIPTAKISKNKDGKYTYTVNFKGIHRNFGTGTFYGHLFGMKKYMDGFDSNLSEEISPSRMAKDKDIYSNEREFPSEYKFVSDKLVDTLNVKVAVDAMCMIATGGNPYEANVDKWKGSQAARLVFDISSIDNNEPKPNENPKISKEIKELLIKDIELAESILKSGVVTGNSKSLVEAAISSAKITINNPKSTELHYLTAREVLRFAIANIKKDPNPNNGGDNLIGDKSKDKTGDSDNNGEDKKKQVKKYRVPVKMVQAYNQKEASMGDKAIDREAIVYTKDGKSTIYLGMKGISLMNKYGHLTDMLIYPGSSMSSEPEMARVYKTYIDRAMDGKDRDFPRIIAFNRPTTKESKIYIKVYVDAMDSIQSNASSYDKIVKGSGAQNAMLEFDWSNAKDISGQDGIDFDAGNEDLNGKNTERLAGSNRYETSAKISQKYFSSADTVILASGKNNADALVSASFANAHKAPILLTNKDTTDESVLNEISRLKAKNIIIVGGSSSVSYKVEGDMRKKGYSVRRIAGNNRYETSAMIAQEVKDITKSSKAILINGSKDADALTVSGLATSQGLPVIMTRSGELEGNARAKFNAWNLDQVYVVGGTNSISDSVVNQVSAKTKTRLSGQDRFKTALAIADESYPSTKKVMFANGYNSIDALSAGAVTARAKMPILLVNRTSIPNSIKDRLNGKISQSVILGGESTIANGTIDSLSQGK